MEDKSIYTLLKKPIRIGNMTVKNRMVMPPMNTNYSNENGAATPQMADYYVRRAKGGAGLIIIEAVDVVEYSKNHGVQPMIGDEKYIPGWANLVDRIKRYGAKVSIEIAHYGSEAAIGPKVSASPITSKKNAAVRQLTVDEIIEIEDDFVRAVKNAKKAGFDAVTLHAAHGYFLGQFLSPAYNLRQDEFGGSTEKRLKILLDIIKKVKHEVGSQYPIMVRISGDDYLANGNTVKETKEMAVLLEKAGIAAIDISAGTPASVLFCFPPYSLPGYSGMLVPIAKAVKEVVDIPVIVACGIRDPQMAENILSNKEADLIALGRTLIADPDFCNKVMQGKDKDIRQCLSCEQCIHMLESGLSIRCSVNAEAGREYEFTELDEARHPRKVVVIGGGPAGMEAARIAALRGHRIILFEKGSELGGALNAAKVPPNKEKIAELIRWYEHTLKLLNVEIRFNTEVTDELLKEQKADAVISAGGSEYLSRLPGCSGINVLSAVDALKNPEKVGKKIVIIGGGATGCEVAEYFTGERVEVKFERVKDVQGEMLYKTTIHEEIEKRDITIIEMLDEICSDMDVYNRSLMRIRLKENGVKVMVSTKIDTFEDGFVNTCQLKSDEKSRIQADTIICAFGTKPKELGLKFEDGVYKIGDANKTGKIIDAIYDGYCAARMI